MARSATDQPFAKPAGVDVATVHNPKGSHMINSLLTAIAHGTQVGSEGIIAILIGFVPR